MTAILTPPAPLAAPPSRLKSIQIGSRWTIPTTVVDLDSFRAWVKSDAFPEKARAAWLDGQLWVDPDMEQAFSHNDVKGEIGSVLRGVARDANLGRFFVDGMLLCIPPHGFATGPDGLFLRFTTIQSGRVRMNPNSGTVGVVEIEGVPDMVLEVVSDSSVGKDTITLPQLHHAAGTPEFWRVDARRGLTFEILRHDPSGYVPTLLPDGWWHSDVFGHDFRLRQEADPMGQPEYFLDVR